MCLTPVKIKAVSPNAPDLCYVPCGYCKDCRNSYKSQWQIRLSAELIQKQKQGWYVGFVTLTYDDEHLPHVPDSLLLPNVSDSVPCFSREHIRKFVVDIRRDLDEFWNVHGLVYMICGEYGSYTRRPHYHCIFSWPKPKPFLGDEPSSDECGVDAVDFWSLIKKYWKYGYVIPKDMNGGRDSKRRIHKPFLVSGSARFAGVYASKYTCKDLDYLNEVRDKVNTKDKLWNEYKCFHCQSRSLGLSWLRSKSDDEIRDLFFNGLSFHGDMSRHQLPVYFRNKILFSPYYVVERKVYKGIKLQDSTDLFTQRSDEVLESEGYRVEYKRLVRRKCTDFFFEHREQIFNRRVAFWRDALADVLTDGYLESKGIDSSFSSNIRAYVTDKDVDMMAEWIVSRHHVPYDRQYVCDSLDLWYSRYALNEVDTFVDCSLLARNFVDYWDSLCDYMLNVLGLIYSTESEHEVYIRWLQDKIKSGG